VDIQVRKQREKAGLFKVDRQRQLVLTTQPRLIYLDPSVKNVKTAIKGVVRLRTRRSVVLFLVFCVCADLLMGACADPL